MGYYKLVSRGHEKTFKRVIVILSIFLAFLMGLAVLSVMELAVFEGILKGMGLE